MARRASEDEPGIVRRPDLTWEVFQNICGFLAQTGAKYKSCELGGIAYNTVLGAMHKQAAVGDLSWQELWDTSTAMYREMLVTEAKERAVDGWQEPIFGTKGEVKGYVHKKSDRLLELMLTRQVPEFQPNSTVTVRDERPGHGLDIFKELSLDAKKRIRDIMMEDLQAQRDRAAERQQITSSVNITDEDDNQPA